MRERLGSNKAQEKKQSVLGLGHGRTKGHKCSRLGTSIGACKGLLNPDYEVSV